MELERYCVVDVETTGFSPAADRIVEVACALVDGERIVGSWATLVHPGMAIPAVVTAIHGITDAMVAQAPSSEWALRQARRLRRPAHCGALRAFRSCVRRAEGRNARALHYAARASALPGGAES